MNTVTRLAVGALSALAIAAPVTIASPSPATAQDGKSWTTIERGFGAKHQACKVSINGGDAWKIYNRLNSSKVTGGRLRASMTRTKGGEMTSHDWQSGWVRKGHISDVGFVTMPRKPGIGLAMSLAGDNAGTGGVVKPSEIGRC